MSLLYNLSSSNLWCIQKFTWRIWVCESAVSERALQKFDVICLGYSAAQTLVIRERSGYWEVVITPRYRAQFILSCRSVDIFMTALPYRKYSVASPDIKTIRLHNKYNEKIYRSLLFSEDKRRWRVCKFANSSKNKNAMITRKIHNIVFDFYYSEACLERSHKNFSN